MTNELAPKDDVLAALEAAFADVSKQKHGESLVQWYDRVWHELEAEAKAIESYRDGLIKNIKEQAERKLNEVYRRIKGLQWKCEPEFKIHVEAMIQATDGKKKSVNLYYGEAGYKTNPARLQVDNEEMCIAWAEKNIPEAVETIKILGKNAIKRYFKETGELPDGCNLIPERQVFRPHYDGTPRLTEGDGDDNNL